MRWIKFEQESLHNFLKEFDYIKELYSLNDDEAQQFYMPLSQYEESRQFAHMVKRSHSLTYDNVKLIYNDTADNSMEIMECYELTRHKMVEQFLNIAGTEKLFSEKYFDFEWDMHTRIRYDESKHDFYRDHFIHQIRDMFEILSFLDDSELNFACKIENIIMNNQTNKVCRYMYNKATAHIDYIKNNRGLFSTLSSLYSKRRKNPSEFLALNEFLLSHSLKQLTKKSCITTALFHDIGYPVEHTLKINERITDYITLVHSLNEANINFNRIFTLLETSLLFEIVSKKEIIERLNKRNHGALSAVIFLLHFYESETIKPYSPLEEAVIEISALAIYNHTLDYSVATGNEEYYVNAVYKNNPISSLFRLCDDIQEWDRVYFDYKNNTEIIICDICKTPIIKTKIHNNSDDNNSRYLCKCNTHCGELQVLYNREPIQYNNSEIFKRKVISDIKTTKISIVKICDEVKIYSAKNNENYNTIKIKYSPYTLLQMARVDSNFAKYRCNDLKKLKLMIRNQIVANNDKEFFIDYFLSSNPILLKTKILYDFFMRAGNAENVLAVVRLKTIFVGSTNKLNYLIPTIKDTFEEKMKSIYIHNNFCHFCKYFVNKIPNLETLPNSCTINTNECLMHGLHQSIYDKIKLYVKILCYWITKLECEDSGTNTAELNTFWDDEIEKSILPRETTQLLLKYCKKHIDMYVDVQRNKLMAKQYFELFCFGKKEETEEYIYYNSISKYCEPSFGECKITPDDGLIDLDYYTDLLFFYEIKEEIIAKKLEKKLAKKSKNKH